MAIAKVSFHVFQVNICIFHSYVCFPEGNMAIEAMARVAFVDLPNLKIVIFHGICKR